MVLPPDTQSPAYHDILRQRAIHAMNVEMKKWILGNNRETAVIRTGDILCKLSSYFISRMKSGDLLFVGEGNLSFALGISKIPHINPSRITATTYEDEKEISEYTKKNAYGLWKSGATVVHGVDAGNIQKHFPYREFDTIVFQFPNTGSRLAVEGRNPNFILLRNFLKSAAKCLKRGGNVLVTAVDSPYYQGAFQFGEAAASAGFRKPETYPFDPGKLSGYIHTNTNDESSAIDGYDTFCTWVFTLKDGYLY
ncbi:MAG: class I SAM-dependent methyltransferase [Alphaproteobacteria bacterium]|nr:class I SAM-dependent methyltransferase [Alphaproteobacteria bacterium]